MELSSMNESQLRHALKNALAELETRKTLFGENSLLRSELNIFKSKVDYSKFIVNENCKLKKQIKSRRDVSELWKKEKEYFFEREEQLNQTTKERDFLSKQLKYKDEYILLKKTNTDLKAALSTQEKELRMKTHVLEVEVEKTQKKADKLQKNNDRLQEENKQFQLEKNKLQKQMSQRQLELSELQVENKTLKHKLSETCRRELDRKRNACALEMRCRDLEKELERTIKKLKVKYPDKCFKDCQDPSRHERKPGTSNLELKSWLTVKSRQLEKKDHVLKEKEKQIEELKQDMSRLVPPEMVELIPKCQWVIREQNTKIKALTAQVNMYQSKDDEYKRERETLADRATAMNKLYLEERKQNTKLMGALETKLGIIPLRHSSHVLQKQSRENQLDTMRPTLKPIAPCLPPISNKSQPKLGVKLGHTQSSTAPHKVLVSHSSHVLPKQSRENQLGTIRPTLKPIAPCLPPISNKSQPKLGVKLGHTQSSTAPHKVLVSHSSHVLPKQSRENQLGTMRPTIKPITPILPPISNKSSQVKSTVGWKKST